MNTPNLQGLYSNSEGSGTLPARAPLRRLLALAAACCAALALPGHADDTEIYKTLANNENSGRPKVIIVFDDSGSMGTEVSEQRPAYDPDKTDYDGGVSSSQMNRIYWSTTGSVPSANSNQWFEASANRCASSYEPLAEQGLFLAGAARSWELQSCESSCQLPFLPFPIPWNDQAFCEAIGGTFNACSGTGAGGDTGTWEVLGAGQGQTDVDCQVDHTAPGLASNSPLVPPSPANGFAVDGVADSEKYSAATLADSNVEWFAQAGQGFTFYSANYVDYWNDDSILTERSRLDIAQEVISSLVQANTLVDFGLAVFNDNSDGSDDDDTDGDDHGGRIVQRIIENMSDEDRTNLVDLSDSLTDDGWTPLCETTYEVYRYLSGSSVLYGDNRDTSGNPDRDLPERDLLAEDENGNYLSPTSDCAYVYIILMTDGLPTFDYAANDAIESNLLDDGESCRDWEDDHGGTSKNCLPELAGYMATHDLDGDASNGNQFAITYTIGFQTSQELLNETATLGGGSYYEATNADELQEAFQGALIEISTSDTTLTSPAVAVDSFNRTQTREEVYYAMFKPDNRVDWRGNVKKLKIDVDNGDVVIVDRTNQPAFDATTGQFRSDASTFWSTADGGTVDKGGVGELLAARNPADRTILSNTGAGNTLEPFVLENLSPVDFGLDADDDAGMYLAFGVESAAEFEAAVYYGRGHGINADGTPTDGAREWVMADVMHSQPIILDYGALGSATLDDPDLRLLVSTNGGFLHMFDDTDGSEDWAFFPKELAPILNRRRLNPVSNDNVYGLDLTPAAYRHDENGDRTIDASDGDKLWVYQGMRRGGRNLYALDLSNPDSPSLMWMKTPDDVGMSELGQTWSAPLLTRIPSYRNDEGEALPVIIVGAGYDTSKDNKNTIAQADSMGRGVFILDAETGELVRSLTPAPFSPTNMQVPLAHSVAADITLLDSNADDLTDRLYIADTGGNLWRVDLSGPLPTSGDETWRIVLMATLNGGETDSDRRFFNKPDVVRTLVNGRAVDALLIGSGDRTNPLATDVENFFYLIYDEQTRLYTTDYPTDEECEPSDDAEPVNDFRCKLPVGQDSLFEITEGPGELEELRGWKFDLPNLGEKALSESVTLANTALFTTFTPASVVDDINVCEPVSGVGRLYGIDIDAFLDPNDPLDPNEPVPSYQIPGIIPDLPALIIPPDPDGDDSRDIHQLLPPSPGGDDDGDEEGCRDGACETGKALPTPQGYFWYREEY